MRQLVWLVGCALVLSCTVNSSDLYVDAGSFGAGGQVTGSGGTNSTGGQIGTGGQVSTGGQGGTQTGQGGQGGSQTGQAGIGGRTGLGGRGGHGGQTAAGGQSGQAGQSATGGQTGQTGGNDGQGGTGGDSATGGHGGSAGQTGQGGTQGGQGGSTQSCTQIQAQYTSALSAAKACSPDAFGQCQQLVETSLSCRGCQSYVNDTTELDAIAASWMAAGCDQMHAICPAFACVAPQSSRCVVTSGNSGGPGPGAKTSGTCTPSSGP